MDTVGGYRLVRKLGAGGRAEIHLGHAGSREPPDGDRIAAIKVYRMATDDASIDREIEALARASSRHLLELRDLATGPDGRPCLVLPRLGSGTLARFLAIRRTLAPGEAVSILAPLVGAVCELHRVGVSHGAVAGGSVLFDDRGAPVLARFGAVTLIGDFPSTKNEQSLTPAQLDDDPGAILDRLGLRQLIAAVLDRVDAGGSSEASVALRDGIESLPSMNAALLQTLDLVFDLASALPIRFDVDEELDANAMSPTGWHGAGPPGPQSSSGVHHGLPPLWGESDGRTVELARGRAEPAEIVAHDVHPLAILRSKALAILAPVRTPVWIAGGAGLGALVIALTVIPAAHSETGSAARAGRPSSQSSSSIVATASAGAAPSASASLTSSAIEGEDPLAAARALLSARTRCFVATSPTCFDSVDQAGSAVIEADRDLFRRVKKGVPLPPEATLEGFTPRLIQQLGDSAIIQLVDAEGSAVTTRNPAPLLLVRSEAGWRIRDLALG